MQRYVTPVLMKVISTKSKLVAVQIQLLSFTLSAHDALVKDHGIFLYKWDDLKLHLCRHW
jgi:hypothetical protein